MNVGEKFLAADLAVRPLNWLKLPRRRGVCRAPGAARAQEAEPLRLVRRAQPLVSVARRADGPPHATVVGGRIRVLYYEEEAVAPVHRAGAA